MGAMVAPGKPVFITPASHMDVCRAVNQNSYGMDGVLAQART
jgi:hypothetical protein